MREISDTYMLLTCNLLGGEQSASFANADYDEISDESPTKKKVPKGNETALERSTQGNNYFTLTPTQEEDEKDGGEDRVSFNLLLLKLALL